MLSYQVFVASSSGSRTDLLLLLLLLLLEPISSFLVRNSGNGSGNCHFDSSCTTRGTAVNIPLRQQQRRFLRDNLLKQQATSIRIRDFQVGNKELDESFLQQLLQLQPIRNDDDLLFDPEGPISIDCEDAACIQESYQNDDGAFVVAEEDDVSSGLSRIVGCGGLIVGTPVTYFASGSSQSTGTMTAAIRRVYSTISTTSSGLIIESIIQELEERARAQGATKIVLLGYPATTPPPYSTASSNKNNATQIHSFHRPTSEQLEALNYERAPEQIPGVDAVQYEKFLLQQPPQQKTEGKNKQNKNIAVQNAAIGVIVISLFLGRLLSSVAMWMGLQLADTNDNDGFGLPLTTQEVQRLQQDEAQLQRTSLQEGEWSDLTTEERQEEVALMKIIQGQDVRIK